MASTGKFGLNGKHTSSADFSVRVRKRNPRAYLP
jgi:hypothetical protein